MQEGNRKAIVAALAANAGIALAKFGGWAVTGAASMLAEGVHSVADTCNQALLLWGGTASRRAPTEAHPFGFARERYFWSFVVALVIFSLGGLFAMYEGIHKVLDPHEVENASVAAAILVLGIGLEGFSFRTAVRASRGRKGARSWWAFVRDTKNPELPVVLLEDLGALVGLVIALAGVGLAAWTGDARYDAAGSIAIGVLLGVFAVVLAAEMRSLLIGEAASPRDRAAIRAAALATPGIERIIHMRTQHFGPDELLVALKVQFDRELSVARVARAIDAAEIRIRESVPASTLIFIEPDVFRDDDTSAEPAA